jgi:hypothetical protein
MELGIRPTMSPSSIIHPHPFARLAYLAFTDTVGFAGVLCVLMFGALGENLHRDYVESLSLTVVALFGQLGVVRVCSRYHTFNMEYRHVRVGHYTSWIISRIPNRHV